VRGLAEERAPRSATLCDDADVPSPDPFDQPLILIGYWSGGDGPNDDWPDARDFIDESWDEDERIDVGLYLTHGLVARAWMGYSPCRLCDKQTNGNLELTDGIYIWPEGLAHYVREHQVRLPHEFVAHVRTRRELADEIVVDDAWWRTARPR